MLLRAWANYSSIVWNKSYTYARILLKFVFRSRTYLYTLGGATVHSEIRHQPKVSASQFDPYVTNSRLPPEVDWIPLPLECALENGKQTPILPRNYLCLLWHSARAVDVWCPFLKTACTCTYIAFPSSTT